jgi:PAS domain S-box-containing protein
MLSAQDPMILMNRQKQILHANVPWVKLTGYDLFEIEGKLLNFLHGSETQHNLIQDMEVAMEELKSIKMQLISYRKDGSRFYHHMVIVPIRGGYLESSKFVFFFFFFLHNFYLIFYIIIYF